MHADSDILELDIVTGHGSDLPRFVRTSLAALSSADIPYAVIGAMALAVRGLPRATRDLDVVVRIEDAFAALDALEAAGFRSVTPIDRSEEPEPMYVLESSAPRGEIDVLVGASEPESTVIAEAKSAALYGIDAPVASLEHLLLMYLYSNQPKHLGDFARIVTETRVDLLTVEKFLEDVHPEMLSAFRRRVLEAKSPAPAPKRPPRRRGK